MTDQSGPLMFVRYAYPPNALGYCGPDDFGWCRECDVEPDPTTGSFDNDNDGFPNVWENNEFQWGHVLRAAFGYGMPQTAMVVGGS